MSKVQIETLVRKVFQELKNNKIIIFKVPEDQAYKRAVERMEKEFTIERDLDRDVNVMLDDLERKNPGSFERHKMFLMIKRKLAKERKLVLWFLKTGKWGSLT